MPLSVSETSLVSNVCPVQMGNSEIVLQDDSDDSDVLDIEEFSCTNREVVNLENAAVNIDNSNDVIIGPVTQFNVSGNVTIYQNGTRSLEAINDTTVNREEPQKLKFTNGGTSCQDKILKWWRLPLRSKLNFRERKIFIIVVLFVLFSLSAIVTYVILVNTIENEKPEDDYYGDFLGSHRIYYKKHWGGIHPTAIRELVHPTMMVIISHSATIPCQSFQHCSSQVRGFQTVHMAANNSDIGYNFVIGGDAGVYVGRGWDARNFHSQKSIAINFVGDFNIDKFNESMIESAKLLINLGLNLKKISEEYVLIGHNQSTTRLPLSPGENIYREIKNWPHFSNKTYF